MDEYENPFRAGGDTASFELDDNEPIVVLSQGHPDETPAEKYARLKSREAELRRRQEETETVNVSGRPRPNWPPYVSFLYVDTAHDIPQAAHRAIQAALVGVIIVIVQSVLNIIASCSVSGLPSYSYVKSIIFAFVFAVISNYLTISMCWSKLYVGCKLHNVAFSFIIWQFVLVGWTGYLAIGFPNSGSVGIATFVDLIAKSTSGWSKATAAFNTLALVASLVTQIFVLQQAQRYQRISGVPENMQPMVTP